MTLFVGGNPVSPVKSEHGVAGARFQQDSHSKSGHFGHFLSAPKEGVISFPKT